MSDLEPFLIPANQPPARFYRGGPQIAAFRGAAAAGDHVPEDWVASVTRIFGEESLGHSPIPGGGMLASAISADPVGWLGDDHVARFGADPMLLVKLLDAGQRLPVHAHPSDEFAAARLGAAHGKAEAWFILSPGVVHLGLKRRLTRDGLADLVRRQDSGELLDAMHRVDVERGDRIFVPPGTLHAIGEGTFLVEVQEPEDLSILVEWRGFDLPPTVAERQLGVPIDDLLDGVDLAVWTDADLDGVIARGAAETGGLPAGADPYFRLTLVDALGTSAFEPGFAVVVAIEGTVELAGSRDPLRLSAGEVAVVPAGALVSRLSGTGRVLVARPPLP
jgi:mannose-6-phosphate isomerase